MVNSVSIFACISVLICFYSTMLCIARTTPSQDVRPSIRHMLVFCRNGYTYQQTVFTIGCTNPMVLIQPLQRISASWYRPMHHLGLCTLMMLRHSSFLVYTTNWPVALFPLLLHPPGTVYLLTFDCAKTFSLSNATWKPIYSNSLSPPMLHQALLYLRT